MEELEVCGMLQQCLAMRDLYVFREQTPGWNKEVQEAGTPKRNMNPFKFTPLPASEVGGKRGGEGEGGLGFRVG